MTKEWKFPKIGYSVSVWQNWSELLPWKIKKYNWVNFIPIEINFEGGWYKGSYFEFRIIVLNLGFEFNVWGRASREAFVAGMQERFPFLYDENEEDENGPEVYDGS